MNIYFIRTTLYPDLCLKMIKVPYNSYLGVNKVSLSFVLTKKSRLFELNTLKMYFLLKALTSTYPKLVLVSRNLSNISGFSHLTNIYNISPFFKKLESFFIAQDRVGFSLLSINKNQVNFLIKDYPMITNFLKLDYDFFNWNIPIRISISYGNNKQLTSIRFKYFFFNSLFNY